MTLLQNDSKTLESIKEAKAYCACSIKEAEVCCSLAIWEVESQGAAQAHSIQQSHIEDAQHLLEEERRDQLNFLSTYQATLKASPPESHGMLIAPYHLLLGHMPMSNLFTIPPEASLPINKGPLQVFLPPLPQCTWAFDQAQVAASLARPSRFLVPWGDHIQGDS